MSISFLDGVIPDDYANEIERVIGSHMFPWFWRPSTTYGIDEGDSKDFQFVHIIYHEGKQQSEVLPLTLDILRIFEKLSGYEIIDIYKIKANLTTKVDFSDSVLDEAIHVDMDKGGKRYVTIVYYINDSDGDTLVYQEDGSIVRKPPVKGTAVYFPSEMLHRHTPPKEHKRRMVFNIIVEVK